LPPLMLSNVERDGEVANQTRGDRATSCIDLLPACLQTISLDVSREAVRWHIKREPMNDLARRRLAALLVARCLVEGVVGGGVDVEHSCRRIPIHVLRAGCQCRR